MSNVKRIISLGLLGIVAGGFMAINAQAGQGSQGGPPPFSDFDLDGNGVIGEAEFNEGHAKKMSEMAAAGHQMKHVKDAPGFEGIDSDGNGEISKGEFSAHQAEHHPKMHDCKNKVES
jgi:hypothetical protein